MQSMKINQHVIDKKHEPYIVAEMSGNHNQSLERALNIVQAAADAGAHAVKIQTYTADTMTLDVRENEFFISDKNSLWEGSSLHDLYKIAYTPWEWHAPILQKCKDLNITCFSTPFDETAVDFLETLDMPCYKIASFENTDLKLLRRVINAGKPIIISTGMASVAELDDLVSTLRDQNHNEFALLKCTSTYPAEPVDSHIKTIPHLEALFNCLVGLSDHSMGIGVPLASIALGAVIVEKHFTLDRSEGGVDSAFSLEPHELKSLVVESKRAWQSLGEVHYGCTKQEKASLQFRRTLYIAEDVKAGELLTQKNLRAVRPGKGLPVKYYDILLGKKVKQDLKKGMPISWDILI